jgi:hypothetical protein
MANATRVHNTPRTSASRRAFTEKVVQIRCSHAVWKMLGWRGPDAHPLEFAEDLADDRSLVPTSWTFDQLPLTFELVCV